MSSQKKISQAFDPNHFGLQKENLNTERDQARLNSLGMQHAGNWLHAVPIKALGLHLRPLEFVASVKYRLGSPVYAKEGLCSACKQQTSDAFGDHSLGCSSNGERIFRHNILRDAIFQTAKQAALSPAKEENSLLPGSGDKPADVYIPGWASGRDAALDVSVVSTLQAQLVKKAGEEVGSAADRRHKEKLSRYYESCDQEGIQFLPVVIETLGGWHPEAVHVLTKLAKQLASHTGAKPEETISHFYQRLGILLAKGNSALILNRTTLPDAIVDGDLDIDV